jgi:hypothetical protein
MRNIIRLLVMFIAICVTTVSAAQSIRTTDYATFQSWARQIAIPQYKLAECENESELNYTASFAAGTTKMIQLSVQDIGMFKTNAQPINGAVQYLFNGRNASFMSSPDASYLVVEFKENEICVGVATTGKVEKSFLENIISKSNPLALKSKLVSLDLTNWPTSIPAVLKIPGVTQITKQDPDGVFKETYKATAKLSPELVNALKILMSKYKTETLADAFKEKNVQLICSDAENINQLTETFKNGEDITFIYYIQ